MGGSELNRTSEVTISQKMQSCFFVAVHNMQMGSVGIFFAPVCVVQVECPKSRAKEMS